MIVELGNHNRRSPATQFSSSAVEALSRNSTARRGRDFDRLVQQLPAPFRVAQLQTCLGEVGGDDAALDRIPCIGQRG